jgi:hypothetical protein
MPSKVCESMSSSMPRVSSDSWPSWPPSKASNSCPSNSSPAQQLPLCKCIKLIVSNPGSWAGNSHCPRWKKSRNGGLPEALAKLSLSLGGEGGVRASVLLNRIVPAKRSSRRLGQTISKAGCPTCCTNEPHSLLPGGSGFWYSSVKTNKKRLCRFTNLPVQTAGRFSASCRSAATLTACRFVRSAATRS